MEIKINFVGIFNLDSKGSYKQNFNPLVNYIFGGNRVGKTLISKIPAFSLGASIKLEKLESSHKNFLTILSLNIKNKDYYFIRVNSKDYYNNLYIFDSEFNEIFKGKTKVQDRPNTLSFNKEVYKIFNINNILCKKTKDKNTNFETPYIGNFLEFFHIFEANWGKDWKSFAVDGINIKKEDFIYTFLYLTEEISDQDAFEILNHNNLNLDIKKNSEELKNIEYLLKSLGELVFSNNDIKEFKNINELNNKILKKISENESNLLVKLNKKKNINSKKAELNLILGQLENNIENIKKFNKEYEDFSQDVTIKDNYKKKIYFKDLVDFKIKFNQNEYKSEDIKSELNCQIKELKDINVEIKKLEAENENLYTKLIKLDDKYFDINKKNIDNNLRQIISNYQIKEEKINLTLKKLNNDYKIYKEKIQKIDKKLKEYDKEYKVKLDEIIRDLNLDYKVNYINFINNIESTGAEAVIYSLSKLYVNFLYINKVKLFYIIDSIKDKDQDKRTIKAREIIIKKIINDNKKLKKQIIIFSSDKETLDIDETDQTISQFQINRKEPQSLITIPDANFNLWLETNILKKIS